MIETYIIQSRNLIHDDRLLAVPKISFQMIPKNKDHTVKNDHGSGSKNWFIFVELILFSLSHSKSSYIWLFDGKFRDIIIQHGKEEKEKKSYLNKIKGNCSCFSFNISFVGREQLGSENRAES